MKKFIIPLLIGVMALIALAEKPGTVWSDGMTRLYAQCNGGVCCFTDTILGAETDTFVLEVPFWAEKFGVYILPDSIAATDNSDSLSLTYRESPDITWLDYAEGTGWRTLNFGTDAALVDWTDIAAYRVFDADSDLTTGAEGFSPIASSFLEFIPDFGSDTVRYTFCIVFRAGGR